MFSTAERTSGIFIFSLHDVQKMSKIMTERIYDNFFKDKAPILYIANEYAEGALKMHVLWKIQFLVALLKLSITY